MKSISDNSQASSSYGLNRGLSRDTDSVVSEELHIRGYTVLDDFLDKSSVSNLCERLDSVYSTQEREFGSQRLLEIQESDIVRAPLLYDDAFLDIAADSRLIEIAGGTINQPVVLHLQNGITSRPTVRHHQAAWHRDLPYQNFTISTPLAVSVLIALEEFNSETGGTQIVPGSHRTESVPSDQYLERHAVTVECSAGSAIVFDSMLLHRAGVNTSDRIRRAINNVYVSPILRQQIDFARAFDGRFAEHPQLRTLLGYDFQTAESVGDWRKRRYDKRVKG